MEKLRNESTNNTPNLCCRACLNTDCKLINIHEYKLADVFSCISGTRINTDGLPQHLCVYCSALLAKFTMFRTLCHRSQLRLETELKEGVTLTTDYIRNINKTSSQPVHLSFTVVETIDYIDTPTDCTIKKEPIIETVDINSIIDPDLKTEPKNKRDNVEINVDNTDDLVVANNVKEKQRKKKPEPKTKNVLKIEANEENDDYDYEEDIAISQLKSMDIKTKKRKTGVKIKKIVEVEFENAKDDIDDENNVKDVEPKAKRKRKAKKEVTRKFRKPENDFMPVFDFEKFETAYGVRVVTLNKEEQLAEIADRKSSDNYLSAPLQCEDCGKGFLAEAPYNNHRRRHDPSVGPYACEICSVRFKLQCRRQEHQDLHRLKFFCKECGFVSRSRHQASRHHDVHAGKTFECQHCGKSFTKSSTYLSHVRLAHPAMNVACDVCGETFVGHVGLRQHKNKMHSEETKPKNLKCDTCDASFVSADALSRHVETAGDHALAYSCERCGETCASEEALQEHLLTHKNDERRCEECSQTFASPASYALHYRRKHLNQRLSFAGLRRPPRRRLRTAHCVCEQCGQLMPTETLLRYHQRIHQTVKPFACSHCPKTFAAKHARDWHERTHTGERPFQCPLCPLAFSLKGNLKRHHKAVHLGLRKSIPCSICRRVFTSGSAVRIHINTTHKGMPWPKRTRRKKDKRDSGE